MVPDLMRAEDEYSIRYYELINRPECVPTGNIPSVNGLPDRDLHSAGPTKTLIV